VAFQKALPPDWTLTPSAPTAMALAGKASLLPMAAKVSFWTVTWAVADAMALPLISFTFFTVRV